MTKVYVSATFRDLEECRSAVMLALRRLRVEDVAMESYVAEDRRPVERCLADVAECDLYVGIFAWRYGFIPAGYDRSITELEYRHAEELGKPRLIFLLDEEAPWPRIHIDRGTDADKLEALRAELSDRHMCSTFTGPGDLAALVTAAVANCLVEMGRPAGALHSLSPDMLKRYFDRLHQQYGGLDLDALTPPQREEYLQMRLSSVYIEQSVREEPPPVELPREWWQRMQAEGHLETADVPDEVDAEELALIHQAYRAKPLRRLFDVVAAPDNRAIVLLGDPGSGKSTAARYIALTLATPGAPVDDRLAGLAEHLPLFVELRSYAALAAEGRCDTFVEYLDHRATTDGLGLEKPALLNYLAGGGPAVIIFDGLDEIFDKRRRESVANQIAVFAAEHPHTRVLVTSRVIGYARRILTEQGFVHFTLQDLDEIQIAEFLTSWYRLAMHERPDDARARRARLMEAMRHSQSIHELAGNPMLLTILAIIGKHQALPRERWKLYDHAASVLVEHWDVNRHLQQQYESPDFIDAEDKKELLRRLAYRMQSDERGLSANYIGAEELSEVFESYLIERYQRDRADARALARTMINQFRERNFILSRYGPHLYGFVHRTFLEYFCAEAIVGKFKHDQRWPFDRLRELFEQHWADPSWREVLRLVAGALHERHCAQLIALLTTTVNQPWPPGEFTQPPWNLALAVQCLAEVRNPHSEVAKPAETLLRHVVLLLEHCVSINDRDTMALVEEEILPAARAIGTELAGPRRLPHLVPPARRTPDLELGLGRRGPARRGAGRPLGARGGPLRRRARRDRRPAGGVRVGGRSRRAGAGRRHGRQPVRLPHRAGQGPRPAHRPGPRGRLRGRTAGRGGGARRALRHRPAGPRRADRARPRRRLRGRAAGGRPRAGHPLPLLAGRAGAAARPRPAGRQPLGAAGRGADAWNGSRSTTTCARHWSTGCAPTGTPRWSPWPPGRCTTAATTSRCATR